MIQVIISPAKQMSVDNDAFAPRGIPPFPERTERVVRALNDIERTQGTAGLKALWGVSDKLLAENVERLHGFSHISGAEQLAQPQVSRLLSPAIFSYVGIQYRSMAPEVLDERALDWLQDHLWVLSALYGCARPLDAVQPYRLEMGAKLAVDGARNLYAFWGDALARVICGQGDAGGGETAVVNLASAEYAKAVLPHLDEQTPVVTCVFSSSLRNGKPVQKSTESKTARGSMVRWMAEHGVESPEELKRFDVGFRFDAGLSTEDGPRKTFVFMRG